MNVNFCVWDDGCSKATHQELNGKGARAVEKTTYSGETDVDKDISCCKKCAANPECEYWVRATDSNSCWLKSNDGNKINPVDSSIRRGGIKANKKGKHYECLTKSSTL